MIQLYGQTEAPATVTVLPKDDDACPGQHRGSAGRAWPTVAARSWTPRGNPSPPGSSGSRPSGRAGHDEYRRKPELTAQTLRDGGCGPAIAPRDEQGYIYLQGRSDEMINSGGYNIAPREVEDVVAPTRP